jgi:hypothetical protein
LTGAADCGPLAGRDLTPAPSDQTARAFLSLQAARPEGGTGDTLKQVKQ